MESIYIRNRKWADQFTPQVKTIIATTLIADSSIEEDVHEATDLIILSAAGKRIGMRVRKEGYFERWGNQFTIRYKLKSGIETEYSKILKGFGDWFFYGHVKDGIVWKWMIIDLNAFRHYIENKFDSLVYEIKDFGNETFIAFDATSFKGEKLIIKSNFLEA